MARLRPIPALLRGCIVAEHRSNSVNSVKKNPIDWLIDYLLFMCSDNLFNNEKFIAKCWKAAIDSGPWAERGVLLWHVTLFHCGCIQSDRPIQRVILTFSVVLLWNSTICVISNEMFWMRYNVYNVVIWINYMLTEHEMFFKQRFLSKIWIHIDITRTKQNLELDIILV